MLLQVGETRPKEADQCVIVSWTFNTFYLNGQIAIGGVQQVIGFFKCLDLSFDRPDHINVFK